MTENLKKHRGPKGKIVAVLFALVLLFAVLFRIYKSHAAGIVYDEAWTYEYFGTSIRSMLSPQPVPHQNYHILTSILNCPSRALFGWYEHFIRIPSVLSGIIFTLSAGFIIYKTIRSDILRISMAALVTLQFFVFDLSYLSRGYALGLGAIYALLAFIIFLLDKKIRYGSLPLVALAVSAANFIAFGSMVSTIWLLFSINIVFVLLCSPHIFAGAARRRNPIILSGCLVSLLSFCSLYLLYRKIYREILFAAGRYTTTYRPDSFADYLKQLFVDTLAHHHGHFSIAVLAAFAILAALSILILIYNRPGSWRQFTFRFPLSCPDGGNFLLLVVLITILAMFIQRSILNISLGYLRNGVFLLPIVLLSIGVLLDRSSRIIGKYLIRPFQLLCASVILMLAAENFPSTCAVEIQDWDRQSLSGPLLRRLKHIDPQRTWKIALTRNVRFAYPPMLYYRQFGYKFTPAQSDDYDILVHYKTDQITFARYLDRDFFLKFNCLVGIRTPLPNKGG